MKKIILYISLFILLAGCKSYDTLTDSDMTALKAQPTFKGIDLTQYTFYRIVKYLKKEDGTLYKGPDSNGGTNERYEMEFMAIEKSTAATGRNVIYFSYIPPYIYGNSPYYSLPLYDDASFININNINYIQFGKLSCGEIKFIKEASVSIWKVTLNTTETTVTINKVAFLDRGKVKNVDTGRYLRNPVIFNKIDSPNIFLHYNIDDPVSDTTSDYLKDKMLYYDLKSNDFYFEFNDYLHDYDDDTWIKYSHSRVRANYVE